MHGIDGVPIDSNPDRQTVAPVQTAGFFQNFAQSFFQSLFHRICCKMILSKPATFILPEMPGQHLRKLLQQYISFFIPEPVIEKLHTIQVKKHKDRALPLLKKPFFVSRCQFVKITHIGQSRKIIVIIGMFRLRQRKTVPILFYHFFILAFLHKILAHFTNTGLSENQYIRQKTDFLTNGNGIHVFITNEFYCQMVGILYHTY